VRPDALALGNGVIMVTPPCGWLMKKLGAVVGPTGTGAETASAHITGASATSNSEDPMAPGSQNGTDRRRIEVVTSVTPIPKAMAAAKITTMTHRWAMTLCRIGRR
jgi:hypothetical protein